MADTVCFVVMPFHPELHYFFLYLKYHLDRKYRIAVERGDSHVLTKPLLRKLSEQISAASFVIADISGNNANVFFEVGIAYEKNKRIIFIRQDDAGEIPIDTRQFEFIRYRLDGHEDFLSKLENAVGNLLGEDLGIPELYELGYSLLTQFNQDNGTAHDAASREEFRVRVVREVQNKGTAPTREHARGAGFLLPKILQDASELSIMRQVTLWVESRDAREE